MRSPFSFLLTLTTSARAYWLMGIEDFITTERIDPIVDPGKVASHVHSVLGGSNFRFSTSTAQLRNSDCTSIPIPEDKSNYWFPHLYFQWANGSFSSLNGGAVIYYLFDDKPGTTTAFPDDFRMLSGDPSLRTYDPNSHAQQAVTFLCLDFNGVTTRFNSLPKQSCPSGIRAQINFPSCWDGKNVDSPDHKSHVAFLSGGPDSGTCSDPKFPVTLPRIFIEVYWASNDFDSVRSKAMNPSQPFVYSQGDPTGYGYHADFFNGWDKGVLQNAVDKCHCNIYGDPQCCVDQGIFHMNKGKSCRITKSINEQTTGTLSKLPGNNPVQPEGQRATVYPDNTDPQLISPVYAYTGDSPTQTGSVLPGGSPPSTSSVVVVPTPSSTSTKPVSPSTYAPSSTQQPTSPSQVHSSSVVNPPQTHTTTHANTPVPSTSPSTTYGHTVPTTTKKPTPTFGFPTISFPPIVFPTFSMPHFPGGSNVAKSNNAPGGSNLGIGSAPNYSNNNKAGGAQVPNGNDGAYCSTITPPNSKGNIGKQRGRCPTKRPRRRSIQSPYAEQMDTTLTQVESKVESDRVIPVAQNLPELERARRSHRRRLGANHFMN